MIWGNGAMIAEVAGTQTATPEYRLLDHLGSLAVETDNSGNATGSNVFLPFGQLVSSTTNDSFQFTGLEQDTENSPLPTSHQERIVLPTAPMLIAGSSAAETIQTGRWV